MLPDSHFNFSSCPSPPQFSSPWFGIQLLGIWAGFLPRSQKRGQRKTLCSRFQSLGSHLKSSFLNQHWICFSNRSFCSLTSFFLKAAIPSIQPLPSSSETEKHGYVRCICFHSVFCSPLNWRFSLKDKCLSNSRVPNEYFDQGLRRIFTLKWYCRVIKGSVKAEGCSAAPLSIPQVSKSAVTHEVMGASDSAVLPCCAFLHLLFSCSLSLFMLTLSFHYIGHLFIPGRKHQISA